MNGKSSPICNVIHGGFTQLYNSKIDGRVSTKVYISLHYPIELVAEERR